MSAKFLECIDESYFLVWIAWCFHTLDSSNNHHVIIASFPRHSSSSLSLLPYYYCYYYTRLHTGWEEIRVVYMRALSCSYIHGHREIHEYNETQLSQSHNNILSSLVERGWAVWNLLFSYCYYIKGCEKLHYSWLDENIISY